MKVFQVDAFTNEPFKGNPAGVCLLENPKTDSWMQSFAKDMNLSETAFLLKDQSVFHLRWFSPKTEDPLCGHATIASAHVLWEEKILRRDEEAIFNTKSGLLKAKHSRNSWIEMDFPARVVEPVEEQRILNEALKISPNFAGRFTTPNGNLYLFEIQNENLVKNLNPDFELIKKTDAIDIIVTSISDSKEYDFVSRFFAPGVGIKEDPVTGSAHCSLAPYWGRKLNKNELIGFQMSERTGIVGCVWLNDRVTLKGKAITIFRGELLV